MAEKIVRLPGEDHPITIEPNPSRIRVILRGKVLADSRNALTLNEAQYPPVQYIPRADVDMTMLTRSDLVTYCPFKGDCSYFDISVGGQGTENAVWTYEAPYPAVSPIKDCLAFYPDRVSISEIP
ncbi:MAG: hypothetical protein JWO25_3219 [Alphaproteobacteria bacterium]|nr:hypothetical protein [Alphaproteobacteria bacterium]